MHTKTGISMVILFLFMTSCNLPLMGEATQASEAQALPSNDGVDAVATSVALTLTANGAQVIDSVAPLTATTSATAAFTETVAPTQCTPLVTATANANVRSGPGAVYDIVGNLLVGATATVAGRNDANTWWYINFSGGNGGYAWISGSVVTTACLPSVVQVVAAPPTPVLPTEVVDSDSGGGSSSGGTADLVAVGFQYWPEPGKNGSPISVMVKVTNAGDGSAGNFSVAWLSNQSLPGCSWTVNSLGAGESRNLECQFTYNGNASADYWVTLIVDSGNSISESDEGNNSRDWTLKVRP